MLSVVDKCSVQECENKAISKKLCSKHYQRARQEAKGKPKRVKKEQVKCRSCSGFFTPKWGTKHCTRACFLASVRTAKSVCQHCRVEFKAAHNTAGMFCTKVCYGESLRKTYPQSKVFFNTCRVCSKEWTGKTSGLLCSIGCAKTEANRKSTEYAQRQHKDAARTTACRKCSCVFSPLYGASHAEYCQPCADDEKRRQKAIHRESRKAMQRTATVENVDPFKVFARDKWHCQDCGVSTPRELRGSYDDDAPELDHIKPLSKGGAHSYRNTQCLCRRCNQEKSDTWQPQGEESLQPA